MDRKSRYLPRREAADFLSALGFRVASTTLAKLACVGGGPQFMKFGRVPLYAEVDLLDWAKGRLSPPKASTSDVGEGVAA